MCILTQWRFGRQYTNEWYEANRKYSGAEGEFGGCREAVATGETRAEKGIYAPTYIITVRPEPDPRDPDGIRRSENC